MVHFHALARRLEASEDSGDRLRRERAVRTGGTDKLRRVRCGVLAERAPRTPPAARGTEGLPSVWGPRGAQNTGERRGRGRGVTAASLF